MTPEPNEAQPQSLPHTGRAQAGQTLYAPTPAEQRTARIMGAWFLGTFVFSIPAFWFYDPVLNHANYVVGSGNDTRVAVGALLEILLDLRHSHRRSSSPRTMSVFFVLHTPVTCAPRA